LRDLRRDTKFLQGEKKMNFVNSMAFTAITFVAFTALVALISWWKTRGDNLDTQDGYYLGAA
jgi:SSS family solute:Na+ symporter